MIEQLAAIEVNNRVDPYMAWLAANTALCMRMDARITVNACLDNQQQSKFDNRCTGCRGLFDQIEPVAVASLPFDLLEEPEESQPPTENSVNWTDSSFQDRLGLDEDELEELLAEYFPDEEPEQQEQEHRDTVCLDDPPDTRGLRVPVYIGRCARCGGYMINALERYDGIKDDEVYRCFTCGWRTSPGYEINRAMHAKGM